ncbi:MAG: YceI family protein [Luteibaculum sp.]
MKNLLFTIAVLFVAIQLTGQEKYLTRNGTIKFESNAEVDDDVRAINNQVAVVLVPQKAELAFQLLIKGFEFKKALMQEHFNENYMESDKFPKARFKGKIEDFGNIDFSDGKAHEVKVKGEMEIHGVTKPFSTQGSIQKKDGSYILSSHFLIPVKEYGIEIPSLVSDKIAEKIDVDVQATLNAQ